MYLWTPIIDAIKSRNLEVVKYLKISGAELNIKTMDNQTPLSFSNDPDISSFLKLHGAR